jgi:predicted TIM-barrel fold metal-dependent hydrolase
MSQKIIDVSVHLSDKAAKSAQSTWDRPLLNRIHTPHTHGSSAISIEDQIIQMDSAGITAALLVATKVGRVGLPGTWQVDPETVLSATKKYKGRFFGLMGIDPFSGMNGVKELEKYVLDHGFVGAHVVPHWFGMRPDDARLFPFYAKCLELDIPIQIHIGSALVHSPSQPLLSLGDPTSLDEIAYTMPFLKMVATNSGWPWIEELVSASNKHENIYVVVDKHPVSAMGGPLLNFIKSWGINRILFGADFPSATYQEVLTEIDQLDLSEKVKPRLMAQNAIDLYKLPL